MRCLVILIYLQTVTKDAGSFDLPNPLDNFYEEVVRFYKRLRSEGGENLVLKVIIVSGLLKYPFLTYKEEESLHPGF